jgi:transposase
VTPKKWTERSGKLKSQSGENQMTKEYTREFKKEAVHLAETSHKPYAEVAKDLGISQSALYRWRQEYRQDPDQAFPGKGHLKPTDQEVVTLRKQVRQLQMENDILKKAVVIFTTPKK